jgi:hypothetical protein
MQARICQRMSVKLISTPFEDRSYYTNIRKALVAGFFMQVSRPASSWPSGKAIVLCCRCSNAAPLTLFNQRFVHGYV